ncbi:MAG: hypothetical protein AMXMBFR82_11400 [Candidatus Hydrogenedentota bacterium]
MIIDCHVHILNAEDAHLAAILKAADRSGIDKLCVCSLSRKWVEFPTVLQLEEAAADVRTACEKHPDRFIGFTYVSADHIDTSLKLIDREIIDGPSRVVKLWISQFADDTRLAPIVERAIELDVPVMAHAWLKATGNLAKESTSRHVANLGARYPELKLWMAHCGGRWEEAARVVSNVPNLAIDISGGEPEDGIVQCLRKHLGPERIFFGSDAPGRSIAVQMSKVLNAGLPEAEQKMILGENVRRWLRV